MKVYTNIIGEVCIIKLCLKIKRIFSIIRF